MPRSWVGRWGEGVVINVIGGLILTGIVAFFAVGGYTKYILGNPPSNEGYLDVEVSGEVVGEVSTLRILATNNTENAFDPLFFYDRMAGTNIRFGFDPQSQQIPQTSRDPTPAWIGRLAAGNRLVVLGVGDTSLENPEPRRLFSGSYSVIDQGSVLIKELQVRTSAERELEQIRRDNSVLQVGIIIMGFIVGVILVLTMALIVLALKRKKSVKRESQ